MSQTLNELNNQLKKLKQEINSLKQEQQFKHISKEEEQQMVKDLVEFNAIKKGITKSEYINRYVTESSKARYLKLCNAEDDKPMNMITLSDGEVSMKSFPKSKTTHIRKGFRTISKGDEY